MRAVVATRASEPVAPSHVCYVIADQHDDVSSIRHKLAELNGQRVALVLHNRSNAFDSPIAVHLLARVAEQESIALAIVTKRGWTRYWAGVEGITTFRKVSQVPREVVTNPTSNLLGSLYDLVLTTAYRTANWLIALAILCFLAALAFVFVPRAVVRVQPITSAINATIPVTASIDTTTANATTATVPGRTLYLLITTHGQTPVTHGGNSLDGRAIGYVTFENRSSDRQTIPAGTEVSTLSGVNFHTVKQVVLDPHPGASVEAIVQADYAGPASDVRRGEIVLIQGNLHWFATVVNEDEITGGGRAGTPIVTGLDTRALLDQVQAEAQQQARQQLTSQTGANEYAVPESIQVTPIEENFDHRPGDDASNLGIEAQFRVSALIVDQGAIKQMALSKWQPSLTNGFVLRGDSVQVGSPVVTKVDDKGATFNVPIQATSYKAVNADRLAEFVRLRSPGAVEKDIEKQFDLAAPPTITITPEWIDRAYRVIVVVDTSAVPTTAPVGQ